MDFPNCGNIPPDAVRIGLAEELVTSTTLSFDKVSVSLVHDKDTPPPSNPISVVTISIFIVFLSNKEFCFFCSLGICMFPKNKFHNQRKVFLHHCSPTLYIQEIHHPSVCMTNQ